MKTNPATNATFYELHCKSIFENIDVTAFTATDFLECKMGLRRFGIRDWAMVKIPADKSGDIKDNFKKWKCTDGFQADFTY